MSVRIHPTALVEDGVRIGDGTSVWDHAHLRSGAVVGKECIIGGKAYLANEVCLGDRVKVNSDVYICSGVSVEDGVMISAHVVFTNDRFPRATTPDLTRLRPSEVDEHTLRTAVREGATIGAAAVVGPGLTIGRFAMIAMGAVVTRDVPDFLLVVGSPARSTAVVCRCGTPITRIVDSADRPIIVSTCGVCRRRYRVAGLGVTELDE